jgi:hypothetical protein
LNKIMGGLQVRKKNGILRAKEIHKERWKAKESGRKKDVGRWISPSAERSG